MGKLQKEMNRKKNNGITLIALVITIIVLLILAGVTIATLTGDNGILTKAGEAKVETEEAKEDELRELTALEAAMNRNNEDYYDTNNDKAVIPAGFAVSQVEGENTIEDGLVIIDSNGNEFVWVPVNNYSEFVRQDFGNQNIPENSFIITGSADGKYYEPTPENTNGITEETKKEVLEMYNSIMKNKGFYIARYETGNEGGKFNESTKQWEGNGKAVSKKNVTVWNYICWSNSRNILEENGGAVEKSRNLSKENNYTSVTSTLCYGVQWDAVMRWISEDSNIAKYLKDSSGKGNYDVNKIIPTGSNENYKIKNIYDMAGNVYEWTMERYGITGIVTRGDSFRLNEQGINYPLSMRDHTYQDTVDITVGFRITLFLKP